MSAVLTSKISAVRRRQVGVATGVGLSLAIILLILGVSATMLVDWLIELPRPVRTAILALELTGVGWLVWKHFILPTFYGPDDDEIALAVERDDNRFRGRLISAVQLSRAGAIDSGTSVALVKALVNQAEQMSAAVNFDSVVRMDRFAKAALIAFCLVLMGAAGFVLGQPAAGDLLQRAALLNVRVPRKTRVIDVTGDVKVPKGEAVTIVAKAEGIKPQSGRVRVYYPRATIEYDMDADPLQPGQYVRKIENVQDSFTYRVLLNDGHGDDHAVQAVNRPNIAEIIFLPLYPAYAHVPVLPRKAAELQLLEGSALDFIIIPDKDLKETTGDDKLNNHAEIAGLGQNFPLKILPGDSHEAADARHAAGLAVAEMDHIEPAKRDAFARTFEAKYAGRSVAVAGNHVPDISHFNAFLRGIPLATGTTGLSIHLVDTDGIVNKDPAVHHIDLLPDLPPRCQIVNRPKEELATRIARIDISFLASDDYGLSRVCLRYSVAGGPVVEIPIPPRDPSDPTPRSVSDTYHWQLKDIPMSVLSAQPESDKNTIEFWLHVEDTNNVTSANKKFAETDSPDHYQLRIVSEDEKRKELMARFGALPTEIDPVVKEETDLSNKLGAAVMHGGTPTTQPGK